MRLPLTRLFNSSLNAALISGALLLCACAPCLAVEAPALALLDFGGDESASEVSDQFARLLAADGAAWRFINRDLARAAARGNGYAGSLNLTLDAARDTGRAVGCDFYITGRVEILRRSSSTAEIYFEAYAGIFLVSTRTGKLLLFDFVNAEAATATEAKQILHRTLASRIANYRRAVSTAAVDEQRALKNRIALAPDAETNLVRIADAPEDKADTNKAAAKADGDGAVAAKNGLRLPQPYRRLRPPYTELAARAGVEATVDASVLIKADGEVGDIELHRWAGFGLDEAVIATIRLMHFRPAMHSETSEAIPVRVLLRYNFRRPPAQTTNTATSTK